VTVLHIPRAGPSSPDNNTDNKPQTQRPAPAAIAADALRSSAAGACCPGFMRTNFTAMFDRALGTTVPSATASSNGGGRKRGDRRRRAQQQLLQGCNQARWVVARVEASPFGGGACCGWAVLMRPSGSTASHQPSMALCQRASHKHKGGPLSAAASSAAAAAEAAAGRRGVLARCAAY
jgi:hypothetical protein